VNDALIRVKIKPRQIWGEGRDKAARDPKPEGQAMVVSTEAELKWRSV
jgi:hypothetical protein